MLYENEIVLGDCLDVLRKLPDASVDAVVTDPPYGLGNREPTAQEIAAYLEGTSELNTGGDFMGKAWSVPSVAVWKQCFRVLKPGGYVLSFGGTRTFDLISLGLRAAGFENRDTIASGFGAPVLQWMHGQGFPKSLNIGKAIDKMKGVEREVVGFKRGVGGENLNDIVRGSEVIRDTSEKGGKGVGAYGVGAKQVPVDVPVTAPSTPEAAQWEGWGTALKPAWEPILVFRKPPEGTVAENVLTHGVGGINIDATRVRHSNPEDFEKHKEQVDRIKEKGGQWGDSWKNSSDLSGANEVKTAGRWPPNLLLTHAEGCKKVGVKRVKNVGGNTSGESAFGQDSGWNKHNNRPTEIQRNRDEDGLEAVESWDCVPGCPVKALDEQSGDRPVSGRAKAGDPHGNSGAGGLYDGGWGDDRPPVTLPNDSGGASRFFPQFEGQTPPAAPFLYTGKATKREATLDGQVPNNHPTKKPLELMQWLVRLVCPKKGLVLDPYCGSGTTCVAAVEEGMRFIGIERDPGYHANTTQRVALVYHKEQNEQGMYDMGADILGFDPRS